METRIREMAISDIPEVIRQDLIIFGESLGEEIIKDHLDNSELMKYFIMESSETGNFVGMMSLWIDEDKAQINNFYIQNKYRGLKLGRRFLTFAMEYLKGKAVKEMTLEVRTSNLTAILLYESFGFRSVTVRKSYYANGEDAFLMYLRIGSD